MSCHDAGEQLWTRTDLRPDDVQLAEMYDGFSFITMAWLEAMRFCAKGESGPFVEGGANIARDGRLPLNTHGGQLSAGRAPPLGFIPPALPPPPGQAPPPPRPPPPPVRGSRPPPPP